MITPIKIDKDKVFDQIRNKVFKQVLNQVGYLVRDTVRTQIEWQVWWHVKDQGLKHIKEELDVALN